DDDALEGLNARARALHDLVVDADGVAGVELGDVVTDQRLLDRAQDGTFVVLHLRLVSRWINRTGLQRSSRGGDSEARYRGSRTGNPRLVVHLRQPRRT